MSASRPVPPSTPLLNYGVRAGTVVARMNPDSILPTFDSTWAGLPSTENRPDRAVCANVRDGPEPMVLDVGRLTGRHEWNTNSVSEMSFRKYVLQNTAYQKPDMLRYRKLSMEDNASAMEAWSQFSQSRNWWEVPSTIQCARTFARDVAEVYYLDHMDKVLNSPETLTPTKFPIFADGLMGRWWNKLRPNFVYELYCRNKYGLLIPYDCYENVYYSDKEFEEMFPKAPAWLNCMDFPCGVPLPLPPVLYYFHEDMLHKIGTPMTKRGKRLWIMFRMEMFTMFCAFWYNEAIYGGRLYLVNRATVAILKDVCKGLTWLRSRPQDEVISLMSYLQSMPANLENFMVTGITEVGDCVFFKAFHGTGQVNMSAAAGEVQHLSMRSRRLRLATRQHRRMEDRRSSPMSMTLHADDLAMVDGLPTFVHMKKWDLTTPLTVRGLTSLLYDTASRTTSTVEQLSKEVARLTEENVYLENFINGSATGHAAAVQPAPRRWSQTHKEPQARPSQPQYFRTSEGEWGNYYDPYRPTQQEHQGRSLYYDREHQGHPSDNRRLGNGNRWYSYMCDEQQGNHANKYEGRDGEKSRRRVHRMQWDHEESISKRFRRSTLDNDY